MSAKRGVLLAAMPLLVLGCGTPTPSAAPTPTPAPVSAHGEAMDGNFRLVLAVPDDALRSGSPIQGSATLSIAGVTEKVMGSGSGLIAFSLEEAGTRLRGNVPMTADAREWDLAAATPIVSAVPPLASFAFSDGLPRASLPAGSWTLTAGAYFFDFGDQAHTHQLSVSLPFVVTE